ncbi:hypothetical protein [Psychroserpens algicola]|uniref:hypothetical protein n=1 Tax=Psychroserpens algicola TaxID=1719034 RepID=UPI001952DF28|nr:hypothetical protein [Psychroserpens algicola]
MNDVLKFQKLLLISLLSVFLFNCSKDETQQRPAGELIESPGAITEEDFVAFEGEIGLVLDARPIARKGYKPTQVTIEIGGSQSNFSQTIPLNQDSFMGQLKIPLEGLSESARTELANGVPITPVYKDETGNVIHQEQAFMASFQSNPNARSANTATLVETEANQTLDFRPGTSYYIQRMNADGSPDNYAWRHLTGSDYDNVITANPSEFNGNEPDRAFTFIPIPGEFNTFAIRHVESLKYVQLSAITQFGTVINTAPNLSNRTSLSQIQASTDYNNFKFTFDRQNDGSYIIRTHEGLAIKQADGYGLTVQDTIINISGNPIITTSEDRIWRIVSTNIEWTVSNIGTSFLDPILPPAQTAFSFNSTLTNCGNGTLSQTVGANITETRTRTIGQEETISLSSSNTFSVSMSLDVEFSATLFEIGTTVNAGFETSYSHQWSSTETTSEWVETNDSEAQTLFTERTVTVPSGSASLVYDVYQFYPETRVNFVQVMRVEGIDTDSGLPLSGDQIRTMFYISNFNGVITDVEDTSVLITLKNTLTLDKIIESESNVQDVPTNCN